MSHLQRRPCGLLEPGMCNHRVRLALHAEPPEGACAARIDPPAVSATRQDEWPQWKLRDTRTTVAAMKRGARKLRAARARTPKGGINDS